MVFAALLIPVLLMGLLLVMERVEQPLRDTAVGDELGAWLERAAPEDLERFVSEGLSPALERYWQRKRRRRRLSRHPHAA